MSINSARCALYRWARLLGDAEAIRQPHRIPRHAYNKLIGRKLVRRLWR